MLATRMYRARARFALLIGLAALACPSNGWGQVRPQGRDVSYTSDLATFECSGADGHAIDGAVGAPGCCCQPCCPPPCCHHPLWTARADLLFLWRSEADDLPLVFADNGRGEPGAPIFGAEDLDFDGALGPRVSLIRSFCDCRNTELELTYFGIYDWSADGAVVGTVAPPTFVRLPFAVVPTGAGVLAYDYDSDFHSTEVNLRRRPAGWLSWLAGFRWVEFSEDFTLQFTPAGGAPATVFTTDTNNHLYGFQLGAEAALWSAGPWRVDSWIKAGVYYNDADQNTAQALPFAAAARADDDDTAFLGETGVTVARALTNNLGVRFGYQALWLEGVAQAPDQLLVTNLAPVPVAAVDTSGGVFFHGGFVGLEGRW